jgi:predicted ATPase
VIERLEIEGYKAIEREEFSFRGITLLTGLNSTGKSSVIQSLLLFATFFSNSTRLRAQMERFMVFCAIENRYLQQGFITLRTVHKGQSASLHITATQPWQLHGELEGFIFEKNFYYISSNRIGAQERAEYSQADKFGLNGEYIFSYYHQYRHAPIDPTLAMEGTEGRLDHQLSYWMERILGYPVVLQTTKEGDEVVVAFDMSDLLDLSPFSVGAGNSYLAKIVIMGLSCKRGDSFIIENPEVHLHPKAQSKLVEFFLWLHRGGVQLIIETHCENMIDKLRHAVYGNELASEDAIIYYKPSLKKPFDAIGINHQGHFINEEGLPMEFPSGFFDSTLCELLEMM